METKKLYVAILSNGWWRSEMFYMLDQMSKTEGVSITLRSPKKSWAVPVSNNRNIICRDFLMTDCDYLLMIDHDIVPLSNPALLVHADKDIIGMPAKIRQKGKMLNWNAYMKHPQKNEFAPLDFSRVDDTVDLLKLNSGVNVGAVGTGCILIKRKVLEEMTPPYFIERYNIQGIVEEGEDFYFSKKAHVSGFQIYTTPKRHCEHFHEVGMLDFMNYEDSDGFFIKRENLKGKKIVIGCGSGRSGTLSLAHLLNYQNKFNCTHEAFRWNWQFDFEEFMTYFPKILFRNNFERIPADVASWYLPYIGIMIEKLELDLKVICIRRDLEETKNSWLRTLPNTNHWTDLYSKNWDKSQDSNNFYRKCFPKYDLPKEEAIERYIRDYYNTAQSLQEAYPDKFQIFDINYLNNDKGIQKILDFAGVSNKEMRIFKIHENKSVKN